MSKYILDGFTFIYLPFEKKGLFAGVGDPVERSLGKAETESLVYGPKISFTESLSTNIKVLRHNISNPNLVSDEIELGERVKQKVRIVYLNDIVDPELVTSIKDRLNNIDRDDIMDSSVLAQFLDDNPYSFFPQYLMSELPDRVIYSINNGKVAIFVDRSPTAVICPSTFFSFFETTEDVYLRWILSSVLRWLRMISMVLSILFTAIYVAAVKFHYEVIPSKLLVKFCQSREQIPFPPILEALLLEIMIDLLREAGARLPSKVAQSMGIVGGIVLGQAMVEAGLTSNILIIVVALSALSGSFVVTIATLETGSLKKKMQLRF
ncbi:spore germination protein [Robertmurraya massiliosenegalensis]|uniref:spore germination protein n=1 Tax=Robertmurraya massiliosenegalensis TaxID=1287657 RepID=UPI000A00D903|nr:spore germination protein [Robertmurraya massiliosenegalensis]